MGRKKACGQERELCVEKKKEILERNLKSSLFKCDTAAE